MTPSAGQHEATTQVTPTSGGAMPANGRPASSATPRGPRPATGSPQPGRPDPVRPDPVRPDSSRADTFRKDGQRTETLRGGPVKPEPRPGGFAGRDSRREPAPQPRPVADRSRVRRARLRAVRLDPWSVMKTAFLLSIAFAIVSLVAVTIVWQVLDASGVYESINRTVGEVLGSQQNNAKFDIQEFIGLRRVLGITSLICVVDVVLITAVATLGAFLYNLSASLLGGVEVTLAEDE